MSGTIYTREILRLATQIPHLGRIDNADGSAEKRSRSCGSKVTADVVLDVNGAITSFAWEINACAFGQASAAILGPHLVGMTLQDTAEATGQMEAILSGHAKQIGSIHGMDALAIASEHSARHSAILLPYHAVHDAILNGRSAVKAA